MGETTKSNTNEYILEGRRYVMVPNVGLDSICVGCAFIPGSCECLVMKDHCQDTATVFKLVGPAMTITLDESKPNPALTGSRFNTGKTPYSFILEFPAGLEAVAMASQFGASKYGRGNWQGGLDKSQTLDAVIRHLMKYANGDLFDHESGVHHLGHAAWGLLALMDMTSRGLYGEPEPTHRNGEDV